MSILHGSELYRFSLPEYEQIQRMGLGGSDSIGFVDGIVLAGAGSAPLRWSYDDYYRLADAGFFLGKRVELIEGQIVMMSPSGPAHAAIATNVAQHLRTAFAGFAAHVREQYPLHVQDDTEVEPDVAVVVGQPTAYVEHHPQSALLIVEVAETSLSFDRVKKRLIYARAGVREYWIVNLVDHQLEVMRDPQPSVADAGAIEYRDCQVLRSGDMVAPLARPEAKIAVADLLPLAKPQR